MFFKLNLQMWTNRAHHIEREFELISSNWNIESIHSLSHFYSYNIYTKMLYISNHLLYIDKTIIELYNN
jgi:hypothetical protein